MRTHVLILLCGISPAIVTETVFALAQSGDLPKQIIIITTITGEVCLRKELWDSGVWASLKENLKCDISFAPNQEHLRLLPDGDGNAFDVVDTLSTELAGSFILDVLRQYTENPDTRITFSIAGGRKSMSALGALCMSLLGRHDDRLCHILGNPPFDDPALRPRFYFPTPGQVHVDREGNVHDSGTLFKLKAIVFFCLQSFLEIYFQFFPFVNLKIHVEFCFAEQNQVLFPYLISLERLLLFIHVNDSQRGFVSPPEKETVRNH